MLGMLENVLSTAEKDLMPLWVSRTLHMWCILSQEQILEIPDKRYSFCWYYLTVSMLPSSPPAWALYGQDYLLKKFYLIFQMAHSSNAYSLVPGI